MDLQGFKQTCVSNTRIPIYSALVFICSIISLPEDYKINKGNILNLWFVKLGWFWTCVLLLPYMFAGIRVDDRKNVTLAIFRVSLSTLLWYISVNFFQFIDDSTGFDISGHTFLLIYSSLLLTSEIELGEKLTENIQSQSDGVVSTQSLKLSIIIVRSLWEFMLLQTTLYYHTFLQKIIALVWSVCSWYLVHKLFYSNNKSDKVDNKSR